MIFRITMIAAIALTAACSGDQSESDKRAQAREYYRTTNTVIPATDSLVSISKAGGLFAFSRKNGELIAPIGQVPGAPAISGTGTSVPKFVLNKVDPRMDKAFGKTDERLSLFSSAVNYIYGGGGVVTNFFSIDPDSSRIYMAATAEDAEDGTEDGRSEIGAIYALDLVINVDDGNGNRQRCGYYDRWWQNIVGQNPYVAYGYGPAGSRNR